MATAVRQVTPLPSMSGATSRMSSTLCKWDVLTSPGVSDMKLPLSQPLSQGLGQQPHVTWPGGAHGAQPLQSPPRHTGGQSPGGNWPLAALPTAPPTAGTPSVPRSAPLAAPPSAALSAELQESLAEEAALEAAVARKRSLAVLQASRIQALQRSTAELLQRRNGLELEDPLLEEDQSGFGDRTPTPPRGDFEEGSQAEEEACMEEGEEEDGDGALSLEAATAQLGRLRELRKQVACLEEELHLRTGEVERLSAQISSVELQEQQLASLFRH